ncbi:MAG TPA: NIPSNAP family protein [Rugosimonospora sp.]|nr:NIPSNAP family protein [Rugosimonospora sp.]
MGETGGMPYLEIRSYQLIPTGQATFDRIVREEAIPLLLAAGLDVVAFGPAENSDDAYYLMRAWTSPEAHAAGTEDFYSGAAWREGPREAVMSWLESYSEILVPVSDAALEALRR